MYKLLISRYLQCSIYDAVIVRFLRFTILFIYNIDTLKFILCVIIQFRKDWVDVRTISDILLTTAFRFNKKMVTIWQGYVHSSIFRLSNDTIDYC